MLPRNLGNWATPGRLVTAAIAGVLAVVVASIMFDSSDSTDPTLAAALGENSTEGEFAPAPPAFSAEVFEIILPSLVLISTKRAPDEGADDERSRLGTGVIVNEDGLILTAHHVVNGAVAIQVTFADGTRADAAVVSSEPDTDTAMLVANGGPQVIVPAVLGNPARMRVGDEAYAVGNPLGLTASISAGVISGFNRSIPVEDSDVRLDGLIQFDAAVNPGNSGGPLLNRQGQVIGIVTALANPTQQSFFSGIGFAVPIGTAAGGGGGGPRQ